MMSYGWGWVGMGVLMAAFLAAFAGLVYGAARLAIQHERHPHFDN